MITEQEVIDFLRDKYGLGRRDIILAFADIYELEDLTSFTNRISLILNSGEVSTHKLNQLRMLHIFLDSALRDCKKYNPLTLT